jgi:hypothetical protein
MEVLYIHDPARCQSQQRDASSWLRNPNMMGSYFPKLLQLGPFFLYWRKYILCEQSQKLKLQLLEQVCLYMQVHSS